jgi:hypothetical protein
MKSTARIGLGITLATSLCASYAFAQAQIQPVQPTGPVTRPAPVKPIRPTTKPAPVKPTKPGGPSIQPPRPRPPKPIKPVPPKPVKPNPGRPEIQPPRPQPPKPVKPVRPRPPYPGFQRPPNYHFRFIRPPFYQYHYDPSWAVLYSRHGWGGHYLTVDHSIPDLRAYHFDDRAYAIYGNGRWQVCTKTYYRGTCRTIRDSHRSLGSLSGRVSSIRFLGY